MRAAAGIVRLKLLGFPHHLQLVLLFRHGNLFVFGPLTSDLVPQNQEVVDKSIL